MDLDLIVNSLTALSAATIGASAVLLAQRSQARRDAIAADEAQLRRAVEEVLVRALSVSMRSEELTVFGAHIGSVGGHAGRLLQMETPLDFASLSASLSSEVDALNRAATQVWMAGDPETVRHVNDVVLAAGTLVETQTKRLARGFTWRAVHRLLTGRLPSEHDRLHPAQVRLSEARTELVGHVRQKWGLERLDSLTAT